MCFAKHFVLVSLGLLAFTISAQTLAPARPHHASEPILAATPPMGWNSWNFFARKVTDQDIRNAADQLVATGMRDAGYVYVNIDDTWEGERDANGVLRSNEKFPDMKALADYVHSKGLKLGIYSGPGSKTCAGFEASMDHEVQDAQLYASWGIDYLKYDLCSFRRDVMAAKAPDDKAEQMRVMIGAYEKMGKALKESGRPIVYSLCQYGWDAPWEWAPALGGNLWRTTGDIQANWNSIYDIINQQAGLSKYAGPGHWNDPDMLEVGNGVNVGSGDHVTKRLLSAAENRSHFSMWAMLAAPLLAGNDLPNMTPEVRDILTNREVIAIDQDKLGQEGTHVYSDGEVDVWTRHLSGGAVAVAVLNAGYDRVASHPFRLSLTKLGLHGPQKGKDLWAGKEITLTDNMPIELASHDILLVRIALPK